MPPSAAASTSTSTQRPIEIKKTKRKRVSRACDRCYQKKDRCDGLTPICTFCAQLDRTCTYDRPERKRGPTQGLRPRLEQRISALETVLGYVLSEVQEVDVERLRDASEAERGRWRKDGWLKSAVKRELEDVMGLQGDIVSAGTSMNNTTTTNPELKQSPTDASVAANDAHKPEVEEDFSDSDYSEVDLSLPAIHTHHPSIPNTSSSQQSHDNSSSLAMSIPHGMPLLSSGKGGSSLNRGLVPRGADPNAALGGFTIEFGGNQTDEDWVRRFVPPPNHISKDKKGQRRSKESIGSESVTFPQTDNFLPYTRT